MSGGTPEGKRCFTYCGPDRCDCPAREAENLLDYVAPALPVLETMCRKAGLSLGAKKAAEMRDALRARASMEAGQ